MDYVVIIASLLLSLVAILFAVISATSSMRYSRRLQEWSRHVVDEANSCIRMNCSLFDERLKEIDEKIEKKLSYGHSDTCTASCDAFPHASH